MLTPMSWWRITSARKKSLSERGYFIVAERQADLPLGKAFVHFRDLVSGDMDWADERKARFRRRAAAVKLTILLLTAASTVVLGWNGLPDRAMIALPMVALVTVLAALESFSSWRSRWVLMEETQYRLNRLRDEIDYYLVTTSVSDFDRERLHDFFREQQGIWADVSRRWIEFRKIDESDESRAPK